MVLELLDSDIVVSWRRHKCARDTNGRGDRHG